MDTKLEAVGHTAGLSDEQREWRKEIQDALIELERSIIGINGPYQQTTQALRDLKAIWDLAIDDEDMGPCEGCGEPIWLLADDEYVANEDGGRFCARCVAGWNEPTPAKAEGRAS